MSAPRMETKRKSEAVAQMVLLSWHLLKANTNGMGSSTLNLRLVGRQSKV